MHCEYRMLLSIKKNTLHGSKYRQTLIFPLRKRYFDLTGIASAYVLGPKMSICQKSFFRIDSYI